MRELPPAIKNLTRLRLLDLTNVSRLKAIHGEIISSLKCLEELYMGDTCIHQEEKEIKGNNACLDELRYLNELTLLEVMIQDASVLPKDFCIFHQLDRYIISIGDGYKWSYGNGTISKTLKLNHGKTKKVHLDKGIKLLLSNVEDLCLTNLHDVSSVLYELNEVGFPQLKHLDVQSSDNIQYIIDSKEWLNSCEAFPILESLILHNLPNMMKICNEALPIQSFAKLKVIKVKSCDQLENVFSFSLIKELSSLSEIEISQCKVMFQIIIDEDVENDKIEFLGLHSSLLQDLISSVPFPANFLQRFTNLEQLTLFACEFHSIPHIDHEGKSNNLKTLRLHSIKLLENICQENSHMEQVLQNLQTLAMFKCLDLLTITPSHVRFQNLNTLIVHDCDALVNIISSRTVRGMPALQYLLISRCKMIKEIVVSEDDDDASEIAFMKLELLELDCLPSLTSFFNGNLMFKFPLLNTLYVRECPMMETFSQGIIRAPLLKEVSLRGEFRWNGDLHTTIEHLFTEKHSKEV